MKQRTIKENIINSLERIIKDCMFENNDSDTRYYIKDKFQKLLNKRGIKRKVELTFDLSTPQLAGTLYFKNNVWNGWVRESKFVTVDFTVTTEGKKFEDLNNDN